MKILGVQPPTREQLQLISNRHLGVEIIRGAAGSGKTTTALLRLKNLSDMFSARRTRLGIARPVNVLVLTYNRTLSGYIEALASTQVSMSDSVQIEVTTCASWALSNVAAQPVVSDRTAIMRELPEFAEVRLQPEALWAEVEYVMGRFPHAQLTNYLDAERTGRGLAPRVDRPARESLLRLITSYRSFVDLGRVAKW